MQLQSLQYMCDSSGNLTEEFQASGYYPWNISAVSVSTNPVINLYPQLQILVNNVLEGVSNYPIADVGSGLVVLDQGSIMTFKGNGFAPNAVVNIGLFYTVGT